MSDSAEWAVVIGGSAGSLPPLRTIVEALPLDLRAAYFVVVHTSQTGGTYLPRIVRRWNTAITVSQVERDEPIRAGHLYLAPSNVHLIVETAGVAARYGPREHHMRPAADVLFRSAARAFGPRVVSVILSGYGGDGAAGAIAVVARGGTVIVQDPRDAEVPSMPRQAIGTGHVTHVAPAGEIAGLIRTIVTRVEVAGRGVDMSQEQPDIRRVIADDIRQQEHGERNGRTTVLTCPDCGGVMWQSDEGAFVDFSCHTGHRYAADMMLVQKTEQLETALITALRLLREKAILLRQTATRARAAGQLRAADLIDEQADIDAKYADVILNDLLSVHPSPLSNSVVEGEVSKVAGEDDDP
jgi:two-component system chemotaxis response regulator CheB